MIRYQAMPFPVVRLQMKVIMYVFRFWVIPRPFCAGAFRRHNKAEMVPS